MDKKIENLLTNLQKHNIQGFYCVDKNEAIDKILEIIPLASSVGASGSQTLEQLGMIKRLEARGNKVINQNKAGISREESLELRRQSTQADYYLASPNAVSQKGELIFLSAYGNRTAGIANAKNVIVVCGTNKLTPDLEAAVKRAKEYATPLNYKRLNWDSSRQMCCQILIIEAEVMQNRLKVILVGENLGF